MLLGQISERVKRRDKMVISMEELPEEFLAALREAVEYARQNTDLERIFREGAHAQEEEACKIEAIKVRRMKEAIESSYSPS